MGNGEEAVSFQKIKKGINNNKQTNKTTTKILLLRHCIKILCDLTTSSPARNNKTVRIYSLFCLPLSGNLVLPKLENAASICSSLPTFINVVTFKKSKKKRLESKKYRPVHRQIQICILVEGNNKEVCCKTEQIYRKCNL